MQQEVLQLQAALRERQAELERATGEVHERDSVLSRSKVAIEQLQEEVFVCRKENDDLRDAIDQVRPSPAGQRNGTPPAV